MTTDDKRAFLSGLRDLMVQHGVTCLAAHYDGCTYVSMGNEFDMFDLGTVEEIEKEIESL